MSVSAGNVWYVQHLIYFVLLLCLYRCTTLFRWNLQTVRNLTVSGHTHTDASIPHTHASIASLNLLGNSYLIHVFARCLTGGKDWARDIERNRERERRGGGNADVYKYILYMWWIIKVLQKEVSESWIVLASWWTSLSPLWLFAHTNMLYALSSRCTHTLALMHLSRTRSRALSHTLSSDHPISKLHIADPVLNWFPILSLFLLSFSF